MYIKLVRYFISFLTLKFVCTITFLLVSFSFNSRNFLNVSLLFCSRVRSSWMKAMACSVLASSSVIFVAVYVLFGIVCVELSSDLLTLSFVIFVDPFVCSLSTSTLNDTELSFDIFKPRARRNHTTDRPAA